MSKLDRNFVEWFYEDEYGSNNTNRSQWMKQFCDLQSADHRDFWMRQAFDQGCRAMVEYVVKHLEQWAESAPDAMTTVHEEELYLQALEDLELLFEQELDM